jgi:hypothetical protein
LFPKTQTRPPSNSDYGKSRLARSLSGVEQTLVVDILNAEYPNLKSYRRGQHKAILMDEMRAPDFIVRNKKALQSHIDGVELGQSPTQQFLYSVFLWRTPSIITTNNHDLDKLTPIDREWVEANAVPVCISEPVWEEKPKEAPQASAVPLPRSMASAGSKRPPGHRTPFASPPHKFASQACGICGPDLPCMC